jgi:hypothetical protein
MLQMSGIERCAIFDPLGHYRYSLGRRWSPAPTLAIIMLNPSQADGSLDDPTLRCCLGLSQGWGFGAIVVVNLFAYRSPQPQVLRQVMGRSRRRSPRLTRFYWPGAMAVAGRGAIAPCSTT